MERRRQVVARTLGQRKTLAVISRVKRLLLFGDADGGGAVRALEVDWEIRGPLLPETRQLSAFESAMKHGAQSRPFHLHIGFIERNGRGLDVPGALIEAVHRGT